MTKRKRIVLGTIAFLMLATLYFYHLVIKVDVVEGDIEQGDLVIDQGVIEDNLIVMEGKWLYYPQELLEGEIKEGYSYYVDIPQSKKSNSEASKGYGTYVLKITNLEKNKLYSIYSREQVLAYSLYANGKILISNGKVAKTADSYLPQWQPKSATVYSDENGEILLQMEISNFDYDDGPFWNAPIIGLPDEIQLFEIRQMMADYAQIVIFVIIGISFLGIFCYTKHQRQMLYFALFNLDIALRLAVTSSRLINYMPIKISWNTMVRIEYGTGYVLFPIFLLFLLTFFSRQRHRYLENGLIVSAVGLCIVVIMGTHDQYMNFYMIYLYIVILFIIFFSVFMVYQGYIDRFQSYAVLLIMGNFGIAILKQVYGNLFSILPMAVFNTVMVFMGLLAYDFFHRIEDNKIKAVQATIDPLTGIYNRHYLNEFSHLLFQKRLNEFRQYVFFIDLDKFKQVNDIYGHKAGDEVLQITCKRMLNNMRKDDRIFRYGGDEFVMLIQAKNDLMVKDIARRLTLCICRPISISGHRYQIGASIGIVRCRNHSTWSLEDYIRYSDKAMYKAKESGGNRYFFLDTVSE